MPGALYRKICVGAFVINLSLFSFGAQVHAVNKALLYVQEAGAALQRGNYDKAIEVYDKALSEGELSITTRASVYNDQGVAYQRLAQHKKALENFTKAITTYPEHAQAYNNRGNVLLHLGYPKEAIKDFKQAIQLAPQFGAAFNNRGNAYLQIKDYRAAQKDFDMAIQLMPTNAVPFNGRGKVHTSLERNFGSMRDLTRAIELNQGYSSAYLNRAKAFIKLGKFGEAIKDLTNAIQKNPRNAKLYLLRGLTQIKNKQLYRGYQDFNRAIQKDESFALAYAERGNVLTLMGKINAAFKDYEKAIELNLNLPEVYSYRARTFLRLKENEKALEDANMALKKKESAYAFRVRAEVYEALGNEDRAIADIKKAVSVDKTNLDNWKMYSRLTGEEIYEEKEEFGRIIEGWSIKQRFDGRYVIVNPDEPKIEAKLEMYGAGVPKLLELSKLKDLYRGIILLRYAAGKTKEGEHQYIVVIDIRKKNVIAIEPFLVANREAKWNWKDGTLTVTDLNSVPYELVLRRKPRPRVTSDGEFGDGYWDDDGSFWRSTNKRRRTKRRRRKKSFFEKLFD